MPVKDFLVGFNEEGCPTRCGGTIPWDGVSTGQEGERELSSSTHLCFLTVDATGSAASCSFHTVWTAASDQTKPLYFKLFLSPNIEL